MKTLKIYTKFNLILTLIFCSSMITNSLIGQDLKPVKYFDGKQQLSGLITSNAGSEAPGVLILPAWKGIDDEAKQAAVNLEKEGYIAFVADIYGEGNYPNDNSAASKLSAGYKSDYIAYQNRIKLALDELQKKGANKIVVIGYCFGGTGALEAARGGLDVIGAVCIHGGLSKAADRPNNPLKAKVLIEHPADDQSVSQEDYTAIIKEMNDGNADWQIITYANSKHTFTNPESTDYNEVMAKRAWNHTLMFLKELFQ